MKPLQVLATLLPALTLFSCAADSGDGDGTPSAGIRAAKTPAARDSAAKAPALKKPAIRKAATKLPDPVPARSHARVKAPDKFKVLFTTTCGEFTIEATREWSPNGVDRFHEMVTKGFFTDIAFFRVMAGFIVQFGIHGDPKVSARWKNARIKDDPVKKSNTRGMVSFAKVRQANTRTSQIFINFANNLSLNPMGFAPFGKVIDGMETVDEIYDVGQVPKQGLIHSKGNKYLRRQFPNLDYIKTAVLVK